jgi:hypothetical protein
LRLVEVYSEINTLNVVRLPEGPVWIGLADDGKRGYADALLSEKDFQELVRKLPFRVKVIEKG